MSEIEEQFFEVFGIPPLCCKKYLTNCVRYDCENCENFDNTFSTYPRITDRILLELICILTAWHLDEREPYEITSYSVKTLKKEILEDCINLQNSQKVQYKIQALFKENN